MSRKNVSIGNNFFLLTNIAFSNLLCIFSLNFALLRLAKLFAKGKQFVADIMTLLKNNNGLLIVISEDQTIEFINKIFHIVDEIPNSLETHIDLSRDLVLWCIAEDHTFLLQSVETKVRKC